MFHSTRLCSAGLAALLSTLAMAAAPASAPATQKANTASLSYETVATPKDSAETMLRLRTNAVDSVVVQAWQDGYTDFPSHVQQQATGIKILPQLAGRDERDLLQESLIEAQRNGLSYVAGFDAALPTAAKDPAYALRQKKPDWIARDERGAELEAEGRAWLNPLQPEARRYLRDLMLEAAEQYDIDGLQIAPAMLWSPVAQNDGYTRALYASEHGGKQPAMDAGWAAWQAAKTAENAEFYRSALRAKRRGLYLSIDPAGNGDFPEQWRKKAIVLTPLPLPAGWAGGGSRWEARDLARGHYRVIGFDGSSWTYLEDYNQDFSGNMWNKVFFFTPYRYRQVELVNDRRPELRRSASR